MRLSVRNLTLRYKAVNGEAIQALGPLTFTVDSGSFVSLVGPSGSGKSSLIRILAGLVSPSSGEALLDKKPIREPSTDVGLMFQESNLMPWRTVRDNIALPLELAGMSQTKRYTLVDDLLPSLGLAEFARAYPGELSGGMAQRVAIGRVLVQRPSVLLLDEPFGALDALTRERISFDLLSIWEHEKQTALMVTHDINEAILMSDRVLVLSSRPGRIVGDFPVLLARPRSLQMAYGDDFGSLAQQIRAAIER
ncbi:MAG: ABC transporter ATP-binding protein [Anaerolineae bacterium]|nr:ABC transporter ATP-binding protein [Anaerolineae bacterium]